MKEWPTVKDAVLHVYGQDAWHDEVQIVGTDEALRLLRKLIAKAIRAQAAEDDLEE